MPSRTGGADCEGKLSLRRRPRGRTAFSFSAKFDISTWTCRFWRERSRRRRFCRAANLSSLRQSFDGSRIVRILPLSAISVLPFFAASTVMYCTSLTRMPVEQMVSIRSARPRSPVASAAATNFSYSPRVSSCLLSRNRRRWILRNRARQSVQPQKQKKPFSAAKQALMVDGA